MSKDDLDIKKIIEEANKENIDPDNLPDVVKMTSYDSEETKKGFFDEDTIELEVEPLADFESEDFESYSEDIESYSGDIESYSEDIEDTTDIYTEDGNWVLSPAEMKYKEDLAAAKQKKKSWKRKFIIFFSFLFTGVIVAGGTYYAMKKQANEEIAISDFLKTAYIDAFEDKDKTEIIYNLPKSKYEKITTNFKSLKESTNKFEFAKWQETLEEQFNNQQEAKASLDALYTDKGWNTLTDNPNLKMLEHAKKSINTKYNRKYSKELAGIYNNTEKEVNLYMKVDKIVKELYNENKELAEFDKSYLDEIKDLMAGLTNMESTNRFTKVLTKAETDWDLRAEKREKDRAEAEKLAALEAQKQAEIAAKEAQRLAEQQYQEQLQREKDDAIKQKQDQERIAKEQAEYAKQLEEQRKQQEQVAKDKEQADREQAIKDAQEQEQEQQNNSGNTGGTGNSTPPVETETTDSVKTGE